MAKAILGEVPREENPEIKSSVEIFGEEILELNEKYAVKKESKKPTGKSQKLAPEVVAAEVKSELKVKSSSSVKESLI
ncbi:hypothetical protein NL449_27200, partial [Klebsiella pneumoniae]|nr:hypothetical protein [Klebsiella pneumoniae]